jgi:hypothetical protein
MFVSYLLLFGFCFVACKIVIHLKNEDNLDMSCSSFQLK